MPGLAGKINIGKQLIHQNALTSSSAQSNPYDVSKIDALSNAITGNTDFARDIYKMNLANEFNASEAQKARDFEETMSNSAVTRLMQDLANAGLNPYTAISAGGNISSASSPSGSAASASGSSANSYAGKNVSNIIGHLITSAVKIAIVS